MHHCQDRGEVKKNEIKHKKSVNFTKTGGKFTNFAEIGWNKQFALLAYEGWMPLNIHVNKPQGCPSSLSR